MRTIVALLVSLGIMAALPAGAAAGGQPTRDYLPAPDTIELPDTCAFPVLLAVLVNDEYRLSFPSGRQIISGNLVVSATNETNGTSVVINASGPGHIGLDGSFTAQGNTLQWGPGIDGLRLFEGNIDFGTGVGTGRSVSICDVIAG
jgi:hypothetical protein